MSKIKLRVSEISNLIQERIESFNFSVIRNCEGKIVSLSDGIVRIYGLNDVKYGEKLLFESGVLGLALNLEQDSVGAVVLGKYSDLIEGQFVRCTGEILSIPVGDELLGRVVDALGRPIDGMGIIKYKHKSNIEKVAPGVIWRQKVSQSLATGIKSIDSMIPIGCGQRELIVGDRQTGKTSIVIDTIINQKKYNIKCIYVAIGQKKSSIVNVVKKLEEYDAMKYTVVVSASAGESAALQYISAYSGCSIGEYFRDKGEDALVIYDDLTKQAWAYRQISLLLRRPPGREAYPGDVFYLHSRLLERSARVNEAYVENCIRTKTNRRDIIIRSGSLTALPIIETQAGDVSAFVPTNVISITDGQIFLETDLFNSGIRPAINSGLSVSRVGGDAQTEIIKKLGGNIRLILAQYRELAAFSQFASDLDSETRKQLDQGMRVTEIMKQKQYLPLSVSEIAISLYAVMNGFFDNFEIKEISVIEDKLHLYFKDSHKNLFDEINSFGIYDKIINRRLNFLLNEFKKNLGNL